MTLIISNHIYLKLAINAISAINRRFSTSKEVVKTGKNITNSTKFTSVAPTTFVTNTSSHNHTITTNTTSETIPHNNNNVSKIDKNVLPLSQRDDVLQAKQYFEKAKATNTAPNSLNDGLTSTENLKTNPSGTTRIKDYQLRVVQSLGRFWQNSSNLPSNRLHNPFFNNRGYATGIYMRRLEPVPGLKSPIIHDHVTQLIKMPSQTGHTEHYILVSTTWVHPTNQNLKLAFGQYTSSNKQIQGITQKKISNFTLEGANKTQYFLEYPEPRVIDITDIQLQVPVDYIAATGKEYYEHKNDVELRKTVPTNPEKKTENNAESSSQNVIENKTPPIESQ